MAEFPTAVQPPGGASYSAPLLNFSQFLNWPQQVEQAQLVQQQQQINQQRIAQGQQQAQLAQAFPNGLPTDPRTGQIDYGAVAKTLAKFGDVSDAVTMLQQQPPPLSPMFGGQGGGAVPAPPGGGGAQPASVPAKPLPPPAANAPQGDSGANTITSLVTDRLPSQNQTTGATIGKIAEVMGLDPNADLTPGQVKRAQGLLQKYAPEIAGPAASRVRVADAGGSSTSFADRFAAASPGGGNLPPSANAGTPAPQPVVQRQGAPTGAGAPPAQQPQGQPQRPPQAQPQGGGPIVPQVPLPDGYTDPQKAIQALRNEAARLSAYPRAQGQVAQLNNWADRIEKSTDPLSVGQQSTLIDPRTGKVLYEGPGAAALRAATDASGSPTLDADAELYRTTGKLPPNMGRGQQGSAEAKAIRARAVEQEIAEGGNPADWAQRWQSFGVQATGLRVLEQRAQNLRLAENEASGLIPRVRDISANISRTQYPSLNSLILAAKKGTGGTDVIKLGVAIESLIPVYARVLKPTGQITEGDTKRASDILDKAWSDGQINAALDQMEVELGSARTALNKTLAEARAGGKVSGEDKGASSSGKSSAPQQNTTPGGVTWSVEK